MSEENKAKKMTKPIERVTILETLKPKLQSLCDQANASMNGLSTITKSDVANLILELHSENLCKEELDVLRSKHFDEVRFATWMATRLKEARSTGEQISIMDLVQQSQGLVGTRTLRRKRKSKSKDPNQEHLEVEAVPED